MVIERPLIDRVDLLETLDVVPTRAEATFRWLRRNGFLSPGVRARPRRGNRLDGSTSVFSSLNRDALRAARYDEWALAAELANEAAAVENSTLDNWVRIATEWSASQPEDPGEAIVLPAEDLWRPTAAGRRWSREILRRANEDTPELLVGLGEADAAAAVVRDRVRDRLPASRTTFCRIWRIGDSQAELRALDGDVVRPPPVFTEELFALGLRLGDPVALRQESIAPGVSITTLDSAIDLAAEHPRRLSGRRAVAHVDELLDEEHLETRASDPAPLRRVV